MPKSDARGGLPPSTDERSVGAILAEYATQAWGVVATEVQKLRHDPVELFTRAVQPVLWLMLFGEVMARVRGVAPGDSLTLISWPPASSRKAPFSLPYSMDISAIWERDLGVLQRYLVSPAPRSALVIGKALSAGVRGLAQAVIVYLLALVLGVGIALNPLNILGVVFAIVLGTGLFSMLSLIIACIVRTRERFMGIGQVLTMPIFFASNAIYPLSLMPAWLSTVSHINPLTYEVDALRALMLIKGESDYGLLVDYGVLLGVAALLTSIAARMYGRMGY